MKPLGVHSTIGSAQCSVCVVYGPSAMVVVCIIINPRCTYARAMVLGFSVCLSVCLSVIRNSLLESFYEHEMKPYIHCQIKVEFSLKMLGLRDVV